MRITEIFNPKSYWDDEKRHVFPELNAIFVHIPKTGGTTVDTLLKQSTAPHEVDPTLQRLGYKLHRNRINEHVRAEELRTFLPPKLWEDSFKFAFVRNPWDLMVSTYFWWLQKAPKYTRLRKQAEEVARLNDFSEFLRSPFGRDGIAHFPYRMEDWFQSDGEDILDYIGKLENIEHDWELIRKHVPLLQKFETKQLNKTEHKDYRTYYDDHTAELVAQDHSYIIKRFNYEF